MSKAFFGWLTGLLMILITTHYALILPFWLLRSPKTELKSNIDDNVLASRSFALQQDKKDDINTVPNQISIDSIFKENKGPIYNVQGKIILVATGDVIPARSVNYLQVKKSDFSWAFSETYKLVRDADIAFINLESPLIENCPVTVDGMIFCGDKRNIEGLIYVGVDIANLANNHSGNYGSEGIDSTIKFLNEAGIKSTGISGPTYIEKSGKTFAFLGYNTIGYDEKYISWWDRSKASLEISEAKKNSDYVIVTFHWGTEYTDQPTPEQIEMAHYAIDNGADLVIGNHPHWIQPVEIYKGKVITYAHGNYIFDQMWSQETETGVIGTYVFGNNGLEDVIFTPIKIRDYGQAYIPDDNKKNEILKKMYTDSKILESNLN